MFILNKRTKLIHECRNNDVIKSCKKDPDGFAVAENKEDLIPETVKTGSPTGAEQKSDLGSMKVDDLKKLATSKGIEGVDALKKDELLEVLKGVV